MAQPGTEKSSRPPLDPNLALVPIPETERGEHDASIISIYMDSIPKIASNLLGVHAPIRTAAGIPGADLPAPVLLFAAVNRLLRAIELDLIDVGVIVPTGAECAENFELPVATKETH